MEILRETNIDFLKYRRFWVTFSVSWSSRRSWRRRGGKLNEGIDFSGGTQLTLKFRERPDIQALRDIAGNAGFREAIIQRFGDADHHEVMLRIPIVEGPRRGRRDLLAALDARFNAEAAGQPDLNRTGSDALGALLTARDPTGRGDGRSGPLRRGGRRDRRAAPEGGPLHRLVAAHRRRRGEPGRRVAAPLRDAAGQLRGAQPRERRPQVGAELRQRGMMAVLSRSWR